MILHMAVCLSEELQNMLVCAFVHACAFAHTCTHTEYQKSWVTNTFN